MMDRPPLDKYFTRIAWAVAARGTCLRRRVGCVLVDVRGHVLATGYNGRAAGLPHCAETEVDEFETAPEARAKLKLLEDAGIIARHRQYNPLISDDPLPAVESHPFACRAARAASGTDLDGCEAIHAEQNALLQCRDVYQIEACYATTAPCLSCVKLLMNTACRRIIYTDDYPQAAAAELMWLAAGRGREWIRQKY